MMCLQAIITFILLKRPRRFDRDARTKWIMFVRFK